ncbi:hypothetical protein [Amycolatopsis anabasis]|uniref:hypothetical protein n=1 Tax=Amycolatopsis anabasis TaxID=1840409 RepID=UPI00131EAD51|nr:hypothetical protein [Amycolatopsis anabasis]
MWSWWGHGDPKILAGMTAAALLLVIILGRMRRRGAGIRFSGETGRQPSTILGSVSRWLFFAVVVAAGVTSGLLWLFGWPRLPPANTFGTAQVLDLLKIALAVVAGLGGVVLLAVNLRKQRVTEAEHGLARARDEREQAQSYNERFGTAAEQLAHENAAVRLAGVYAMAGLADDWQDNRQICVDVLCGYLRLPRDGEDTVERKVRQTLLRLLGDRLSGEWWRVGHDLDLDLTAAGFTDVDLIRTFPIGRVRLEQALFEGEHTVLGPPGARAGDFRDAVFRAGETRFEVSCSLVGARFEGGVVLISGERAAGENFALADCRFERTRIVVTGPQWRHGDVVFGRCEFHECAFDFTGLTAERPSVAESEARLVIEDSLLTGGEFDLREAVQREHVLWLRDCELDRVRFHAETGDGPVKQLNVSGLTLTGTTLPERHVRYRERTRAR